MNISYNVEQDSFIVPSQVRNAEQFFLLSWLDSFSLESPEEHLEPPIDELYQAGSRDALIHQWALAQERFKKEYNYDGVLLSTIIDVIIRTDRGRDFARRNRLNSLPKLLNLISYDENLVSDFVCSSLRSTAL